MWKFFKWKQVGDTAPKHNSQEIIRDIVQTCLNNHPKDCIFTPNALEEILKEMSSSWDIYSLTFVYDLSRAIERQEIYCPHEGIDRRAEFGIEP